MTLLLLFPEPGSTGRVLLLLKLAAAASGLAGIMLAPWELSRIEARTERRREGVVLALLIPPASPLGLAEVRRGGASWSVSGATPLGTCCLLPPAAATCGRCPLAAAATAGLLGLAPGGWLYTALSKFMYFDCLSALDEPGPASPWNCVTAAGAPSAAWA